MEVLTRLQRRIECILLQQHNQDQNGNADQMEGRHVHPYCLALDNINIAIHALVQDGYLIKQRDLGTLQLSGQKLLPELEQRLLVYCNLMPFTQYYAKEDLLQEQQQQQQQHPHPREQYEAAKLISKL